MHASTFELEKSTTKHETEQNANICLLYKRKNIGKNLKENDIGDRLVLCEPPPPW